MCRYSENGCVGILKTGVAIFLVCVRSWDKHVHQATDIEDTDSDVDTGGDGYWSHGSSCLSHQHWPLQFVIAGSCNLHDTEDAEAAHKTSMGLASSRVRHFQINKTQSNMQEYLCHYTVFEALRKKTMSNRPRRDTTFKEHITLPLLECVREMGPPLPVQMGVDLHTVASQKRFLHPEARVARVELMNLVCEKLGLSQTLRSYSALGHLRWYFGQVRKNGCDKLLKAGVSNILKTVV